MRQTKPNRIIYRGHGVKIIRDETNWMVANIGKSGERSKKPGEETDKGQTFHPTLASACTEAALRIADDAEPFTLRGYAEKLKMAIEELCGIVNGAHPVTVIRS